MLNCHVSDALLLVKAFHAMLMHVSSGAKLPACMVGIVGAALAVLHCVLCDVAQAASADLCADRRSQEAMHHHA